MENLPGRDPRSQAGVRSMVVCPFVAAPEAEHLGSHPFVSMGAVVSQSPSWGIILHGNLRSALTEKKE